MVRHPEKRGKLPSEAKAQPIPKGTQVRMFGGVPASANTAVVATAADDAMANALAVESTSSLQPGSATSELKDDDVQDASLPPKRPRTEEAGVAVAIMEADRCQGVG